MAYDYLSTTTRTFFTIIYDFYTAENKVNRVVVIFKNHGIPFLSISNALFLTKLCVGVGNVTAALHR